MQAEGERGDHAEVGAGAADAPRTGRRCRRGSARRTDAVGGDDLDLEQVVDGPPEAAGEVAEPAAERQPGDADLGDEAERRREAVQLGLAIDVAEQAPRLHRRRARLGVDDDPAQRATCRASARRRPAPCRRCCARRRAPTAASPCSRANVTAATTSAVPVGRTTSAGVFVDQPVPERRRGVEARVSRAEQRAAQARGAAPRRLRAPRSASVASAARNASGCSIGGSSAQSSMTGAASRSARSPPRRPRPACARSSRPQINAVGTAMRSSSSAGIAGIPNPCICVPERGLHARRAGAVDVVRLETAPTGRPCARADPIEVARAVAPERVVGLLARLREERVQGAPEAGRGSNSASPSASTSTRPRIAPRPSRRTGPRSRRRARCRPAPAGTGRCARSARRASVSDQQSASSRRRPRRRGRAGRARRRGGSPSARDHVHPVAWVAARAVEQHERRALHRLRGCAVETPASRAGARSPGALSASRRRASST